LPEFIIYNVVLTAVYPLLLIYFLIKSFTDHKYTGTLKERLGYYGKSRGPSGGRTLWIHAVSVGEAVGAITIVSKLLEKAPDVQIVMTTTTKGGREIIGKSLGDKVTVLFFPFDFAWVVRRAVRAVNPAVVVLMETELWPNLISTCTGRGIPVLLLNGRVSDRMAAAGGFVKKLYGFVFSKLSEAGMQTQRDVERILALGARKDRTSLIGNVKYDSGFSTLDEERAAGLKRIFKPEEMPIFIAGSTHPGEEEIILDVYKQIAAGAGRRLRLVIAPRHIERAREVFAIVEKAGFTPVLRSEIGPDTVVAPGAVVILDTIGELRYLYSFSTVCFVGGSLIERGGHNVLEPAAGGKAVFYGPYTMNFTASVKALEDGGGGIPVRDAAEFAERAARYLDDERQRTETDRRALEVVLANAGSTERACGMILKYAK